MWRERGDGEGEEKEEEEEEGERFSHNKVITHVKT